MTLSEGEFRHRSSGTESDAIDTATPERRAEAPQSAPAKRSRTGGQKTKRESARTADGTPRENPEGALAHMSPERRERLMQLKKSIEEGTYKIDTDKIAARMMRDIERDE